MNTAKNKEQFLNWVKTYIKREGIEEVINYLEETDFFTAPASTKFHLSVEGGLCQHSLNVCRMLFKMAASYFGTEYVKDPKVQESIAIIGLFHDVCKINLYKVDTHNVKNKVTKKWEEKEVYVFDDQYPLGHGEKSVILLQKIGLKLTDEEIFAIRFHMGYGAPEVKGGAKDVYTAYRMYPLAHLAAFSDDIATKDEERRELTEEKNKGDK